MYRGKPVEGLSKPAYQLETNAKIMCHVQINELFEELNLKNSKKSIEVTLNLLCNKIKTMLYSTTMQSNIVHSKATYFYMEMTNEDSWFIKICNKNSRETLEANIEIFSKKPNSNKKVENNYSLINFTDKKNTLQYSMRLNWTTVVSSDKYLDVLLSRKLIAGDPLDYKKLLIELDDRYLKPLNSYDCKVYFSEYVFDMKSIKLDIRLIKMKNPTFLGFIIYHMLQPIVSAKLVDYSELPFISDNFFPLDDCFHQVTTQIRNTEGNYAILSAHMINLKNQKKKLIIDWYSFKIKSIVIFEIFWFDFKSVFCIIDLLVVI